MKLKNGASIIQSNKIRDGNGSVVLAQWHRGEYKEYITWKTDDNGNAFYGHYFSNIIEATEDFKDRVIKFC